MKKPMKLMKYIGIFILLLILESMPNLINYTCIDPVWQIVIIIVCALIGTGLFIYGDIDTKKGNEIRDKELYKLKAFDFIEQKIKELRKEHDYANMTSLGKRNI